jgi:hypothetical protein
MGFRKPFTVKRVTPGHYNDAGDWVDGTESIINIQASKQPATIEEQQTLPEGRRKGETFKYYTNIELSAATQADGDIDPKSADIVVTARGNYEVIDCRVHQSNVINHYKVFAVKVGEK